MSKTRMALTVKHLLKVLKLLGLHYSYVKWDYLDRVCKFIGCNIQNMLITWGSIWLMEQMNTVL